MAEASGGPLLAAAQALILAGQWELADRLLASIQASDQAERVAVALARAQIAVELRQWRGTGDPAPAIGTAAAVIASADTEAAFDLSLLRLFCDYWAELVPADGTPPQLGPEGRDPATLDELRDRAGHLTAAAPIAGAPPGRRCMPG